MSSFITGISSTDDNVHQLKDDQTHPWRPAASVLLETILRQRAFASRCMLVVSLGLSASILVSPPSIAGSYGMAILKISFLSFAASLVAGLFSLMNISRHARLSRDRFLLAAIRFEVETLSLQNKGKLNHELARKRCADRAFQRLQGNDAFFFQVASFGLGMLILSIFFLVR